MVHITPYRLVSTDIRGHYRKYVQPGTGAKYYVPLWHPGRELRRKFRNAGSALRYKGAVAYRCGRREGYLESQTRSDTG
jgi:hypothetical protein